LLNTVVGSIIALLVLKAMDFAKGSVNTTENRKENNK
jgi:hypothetical protein